MIVDLILLVVQGILNILFAPLQGIEIAVDFLASMPIVVNFIEVVAYVLPWKNITPLFYIVLAVFVFRIVMAIIKTIWSFIPIIGN